MAALRNLLFEYEKNEEKFLEMNVIRDVCKVLIDEQGITADRLPESWHFCAAKAAKPEDQINHKHVAAMIDSLLLLTNTDKLLERMHEIDIEALLPKIRLPQTPEWEAHRARLETIGLQLVTVKDKPKEDEEGGAKDQEEEEELPALEA